MKGSTIFCARAFSTKFEIFRCIRPEDYWDPIGLAIVEGWSCWDLRGLRKFERVEKKSNEEKNSTYQFNFCPRSLINLV
jgi:hypothetical protein